MVNSNWFCGGKLRNAWCFLSKWALTHAESILHLTGAKYKEKALRQLQQIPVRDFTLSFYLGGTTEEYLPVMIHCLSPGPPVSTRILCLPLTRLMLPHALKVPAMVQVYVSICDIPRTGTFLERFVMILNTYRPTYIVFNTIVPQ